MKRFNYFMLVALVLLFASIAPVSAQNQKTIFYNITTDEAWTAGMALGMADKAIDSGYKVVIFLNIRAVFIASKSFNTDSWGASGKSLQDMLKTVMDKGAKGIICPMCMKKVGMTKEDVIDGVVQGGADVTFPAMTADNTTVISF